MIINTLTFIGLVMNIVMILVILTRINRQIDNIYKSLIFIEKKIKEEDIFLARTKQTVERIEQEIREIEGEIDWKG